MAIQSTETVPNEIVHLDFDPDAEQPKPEQEPEQPKTCQLLIPHLHNPNDIDRCGRLAIYSLSLNKPCGHVSDTYLCASCWGQIEKNPEHRWECQKETDGAPCGKSYVVKDAIVRWEKIG